GTGRWSHFKLAAAGSDRVCYREREHPPRQPVRRARISPADTLENLDRGKQLERKLYFQSGAPIDGERDPDLPRWQAGARHCSRLAWLRWRERQRSMRSVTIVVIDERRQNPLGNAVGLRNGSCGPLGPNVWTGS